MKSKEQKQKEVEFLKKELGETLVWSYCMMLAFRPKPNSLKGEIK
jgi:hypothetical protein